MVSGQSPLVQVDNTSPGRRIDLENADGFHTISISSEKQLSMKLANPQELLEVMWRSNSEGLKITLDTCQKIHVRSAIDLSALVFLKVSHPEF
jgi:hypothetical protein